MSTTLQGPWLSEQAARTLSLRRLEQEPATRALLEEAGLSAEALARADRDGNGQLDAAEVWRAADGFDRDGNAGSLVALDASWQPAGTAQPPENLSRYREALRCRREVLGG